ncbi:hypothetical protein [Aeromicrobium sp. Leaf350]|uniref:hypothetical protein n=1 Tax=Aeromicrobium sp. Leaf350 TaxID=2876565 RepID=UPI00271535D0|nr:hypothetical protein [Aeromicrobium sp. Leaf350]
MSTQIAVRLPDDLVAWIDAQVANGAGSRAAVATKALRRYRRHLEAEQDAEIYRASEPVRWTESDDGRRSFPILD